MSKNIQQTAMIGRRQALKAAGAGVLALGFATPAQATPEEVSAEIAKLTGGAPATASDKVRITLPEIAENGATVPIGVAVDSPMTPDSYVKKINIYAEGNPYPTSISFALTPTGKADVNTRIRLQKTQTIVVAAVMSDNSVLTAKKDVKVTIGGCGG